MFHIPTLENSSFYATVFCALPSLITNKTEVDFMEKLLLQIDLFYA